MGWPRRSNGSAVRAAWQQEALTAAAPIPLGGFGTPMDGSAHCCSSRSPWWVRDSYGRKRLSSLPAAPQWVRRHASGGFAAGPRPSSGCCLPLRSSWNRSPNRDCWKYWSTGQEVHIGSITPGAYWRARRTGERLSAAELEKKAGSCRRPFCTQMLPIFDSSGRPVRGHFWPPKRDRFWPRP